MLTPVTFTSLARSCSVFEPAHLAVADLNVSLDTKVS
jgi:hypothetical protein